MVGVRLKDNRATYAETIQFTIPNGKLAIPDSGPEVADTRLKNIPRAHTPGYPLPPLRGWFALRFEYLGLTPTAIRYRRCAAT